jgi:hypothetical protein
VQVAEHLIGLPGHSGAVLLTQINVQSSALPQKMKKVSSNHLRRLQMCNKTKIALAVAFILGNASVALAVQSG